jgi:hypothetical protein
VGETRVDLQHLLEDLRDAYTGALEETILTEVVANVLDSRAARIRLLTHPAEATLTIVDDGRGMQRRELARFHDVAASTKARGDGSRQLAAWGDAHDREARPRTVRLERDLERVLEDLADDFPLLRSLVDRRTGGQKRLPMPGRGDERVPAPLFANVAAGDESSDASGHTVGETAKPQEGSSWEAESPPGSPEESPPSRNRPLPEPEAPAAGGDPQPRHAASAGSLDSMMGRRRPARYGLLVQFESRPGDSELARLVDSTVWINDAHPAFTRATASRSLGYHTALAVALALAPLAVEARGEHSFITQFLAHWGSAQASRRSGRRRAKKRA